MSKYQPLSARLAAHAGPEWRASFAELEELLGFALPKTARTGKTWWKTEPATLQSRAWTEAGWAADVDQAAGVVTFRKPAAAPVVPPEVPAPAATDEPAILKRLETTPTLGMALIAGGVAIVAGLGALMVRGMVRNSKK